MTAPTSSTESTSTGPVAVAARAMTEAVARVRTEAPGWLGGVLAGVQGALFSLALVLIPMWVIAASATGARVSWGQSTGVATRMWLTGFGVPWAVEGVPVTLIPLGLAGLTVLMLVQLARRFASATWTAGVAATGAFAATVGVAAAIAWSDADDAGSRVTRAVLVAVAMGGPSIAWGLIRQRGAMLEWLDRIPLFVRTGVRLGTAMVAAIFLIASVTLVVATVSARHLVAESATSLGVDTAGGLALAFLETLYSPTLVVWIVSWLSGAGYVLGDVIASSAQAPTETIPALPLLATLPHASGGPLALSPLVIGLLGMVLTITLRKRLGQGLSALAAIGVALAFVAVTIGLASRAARGAIGPGTLERVGPEPLIAALMPTLEMGVGALLGLAIVAVPGAIRARRTRERQSRSVPLRNPGTPADTPASPEE